jgi:DNA-binding CsgD family transcriptional regulator/pimeloyl-ACP methyl ester carboxylesterase
MPVPPVQYVKTRDGFDIAYMVNGEGPPLVLLPNAWCHNQLFWRTPWRRTLFDALTARYRLVQFDSRGQGLSSRGLGAEHSREAYCLDLEAVVAHLELDRFVLLSRNLFCQVAIEYALRNPTRVVALILGNPAARLYQGFEGVRERQWDLYTETIARLTNLPGEPALLAEQFRLAVNQHDHIKLIEALTWNEVPPEVASLQVPALVFDSSTSPLSSQQWRVRLAAAIPNARLVTLDAPDSGFFSTAGETPLAIPVIENFLATLGVFDLSPPESAFKPGSRLSPRETEVLRLIASGRSNQQIADELVLSVRTVERHITNLYGKIGAHGKADATAYALRHGLS